MKQKIQGGIVVVWFLLLIVSGCGGGSKNGSGNTTPTPTPVVYTAGYYYNSDLKQYVPCYWKGTTLFDLFPMSTAGAQARSIFVSDSAVYIGGYHESPGFVGCYWPGTTTATDATDFSENNGYVYSIYVSDGKVYTAGRSGQPGLPCYWVDDVRSNAFELPTGATLGEALSIYVEGSTVYSGGWTGTSGTATKPCYWAGTTLIPLQLPVNVPVDNAYGKVNSIYISNNTVYTAGYIYIKGASSWETLPCYWVNQSGPNSLQINGSTYGEATGIQVVNGKTYIAGWYGSVANPCFWTFPTENGELPVILSVPTGSNSSKTTSIYVAGSTIYLAGWYQMNKNGDIQEFPCYWNGNTGVLTPLPTVPTVTSHASANAIFVK